MSFTQDELQALNTILDQKLAAHRRDLELSIDQRMQGFQSDFEQHLTVVQQNVQQNFTRQLADQQGKTNDMLARRLDEQQTRIIRAIFQEIEQVRQEQQKQNDDLFERALAAQLLAFEQLINQRRPERIIEESASYTNELAPDFDTIEVQTEIPWDDLVDIINHAMDERVENLKVALLQSLHDIEQNVSAQLRALRESIQNIQNALSTGAGNVASQLSSSPSGLNDMQDIFQSMEQLERLIESLQVAMAANSALISSRLYHHQQLPVERAHSGHLSNPENYPTTKDPSSVTTE